MIQIPTQVTPLRMPWKMRREIAIANTFFADLIIPKADNIWCVCAPQQQSLHINQCSQKNEAVNLE